MLKKIFFAAGILSFVSTITVNTYAGVLMLKSNAKDETTDDSNAFDEFTNDALNLFN